MWLHWFVTAVHCVVVVIVTIGRMHLLDSVYMLFALEVRYANGLVHILLLTSSMYKTTEPMSDNISWNTCLSVAHMYVLCCV